MSIEFAPCYGDMPMYLRLAKEYVKELQEHDSAIIWDEDVWKREIWNAWFIKEGLTTRGFVITEEMDFKVYNKLLYVEEFYVVPDARRKGIGFEAAKKLSEMWGGDMFLYVLDNNSGAKWFWTMVEERLGWKRIERKEIREEHGCELRVYQTRELST